MWQYMRRNCKTRTVKAACSQELIAFWTSSGQGTNLTAFFSEVSAARELLALPQSLPR